MYLDKVRALKSSCCTKTPATSTDALVFNRGHSSLERIFFVTSIILHNIYIMNIKIYNHNLSTVDSTTATYLLGDDTY